MAGRWPNRAYKVGNTFLPLSEIGRTLTALRNLFAGAVVGGARTAEGALREAREATEAAEDGRPFEAPERRWVVRQWRAGMALVLIGALALASLWLADSLLAKIAMIVLSTGLIGTGLSIAGAMSYLVRKSAQPNLTFADWVRRPSIWI